MKEHTKKIRIEYNDKLVRQFMIASIFWGLISMAVGVLIASQLNFWQLNLNIEWLTFGRLRPLHTNAAIFAFVGNMMFAGIYYSTQRLLKTRTVSDFLSQLHFWGWQLIIVSAAITLPLGFSRGKEYAELIWPINIAVALIWVVFAINFFLMIIKRNERTLYVAIWFYIATIITIAMLYIVNHLSLPTSLTHSYPIFAGVQDALVQWWYGHNAVAFFLTTPILGIMYYFVPKAADRPVYSYRLSIVHFWSLAFIYIWAGPHHLLNTALPEWLQTLGMLFSLMLWAPSWGGMLNGLLTLRGAWHKLRTDPVLKFFAAAVTFYGMATFEGPLLSIKSVNALAHYTDWIIGHVHAGTLGWNGFMAAGLFYWLAPRLWKTKLYSVPLANMHFWLGLVGILLYVGSMWVSGITQGLMLNATAESGTVLAYPNFIETSIAIRSMMLFRIIGGGLYFFGFILLAYNIIRTVKGKEVNNGSIEVYVEENNEKTWGLIKTIFNTPVLYCVIIFSFICLWLFGGELMAIVGIIGSIVATILALLNFQSKKQMWADWHEALLARAVPFTALTLLAVIIGGAIQIIPTVIKQKAENIEDRLQIPYTPLELAGRDIYISEGCYNCHSQMIRTLVPEVMRYGDYSRIGESIYDHPFQWGSRRTGPDLARVGGKYPDIWHYHHMMNPRSISAESNMPNYPWLFEKEIDYGSLPGKIRALRKLSVPYPEQSPDAIISDAKKQSESIIESLKASGGTPTKDTQILAVIAYLQKLGKFEDVSKKSK
jgi:cytochrome c oxidase cbb3-type subunit I/II